MHIGQIRFRVISLYTVVGLIGNRLSINSHLSIVYVYLLWLWLEFGFRIVIGFCLGYLGVSPVCLFCPSVVHEIVYGSYRIRAYFYRWRSASVVDCLDPTTTPLTWSTHPPHVRPGDLCSYIDTRSCSLIVSGCGFCPIDRLISDRMNGPVLHWELGLDHFQVKSMKVEPICLWQLRQAISQLKIQRWGRWYCIGLDDLICYLKLFLYIFIKLVV